MKTHTKLVNLIQADRAAGKKVEWIGVSAADRAVLITELVKAGGVVAKKIKDKGIYEAMPTLTGVPIRWGTPETMTKTKG